MKFVFILLAATFSGSAMAKSAAPGDYLVKLSTSSSSHVLALQSRLPMGTQVENLGVEGWTRVRLPATSVVAFSAASLSRLPGVIKAQPNYAIKLMENPALSTPAMRERLARRLMAGGFPGGDAPAADNPEIPMNGSGGSGPDPLFSKQWGMNQMGVSSAWSATKGNPDMVVAVIDTGVDYTHEDLVDNMWRNPGETGVDAQGRNKATNGIDDDGNGYVDDVVGWDFAANDNKPYDLTASMFEMLLSGGNPGHGTHCAGNVAARSDNGKGVAGVAPNVRVMALRFISEKGQGTTADAVKAIKYAVDNGAKVTSNSWGSEGDDPADADTNALKDAIQMAQDRGVLFIAAAGNGHQGVGYDNDTDAKPAVPASYTHENIISVAAIDVNGALGSFSNWGARSVDLGAPGVKVFSTVTQSEKYSDTVIDIPGLITATWDGTSMATPHVAGAAALYWSLHPEKSWRDVKNALLGSVKRSSVLQGKTTSGGQLDVQNLMNF
ncbi:MAG: S8 family serine peptidase [Bdellovibrionales bacterium]